MWLVKARWQYSGAQFVMLALGTPLAPGWLKFCHGNSQGLTCLTSIAMWAVGEQPTASKTLLDQVGVCVSVDQMPGRGHL